VDSLLAGDAEAFGAALGSCCCDDDHGAVRDGAACPHDRAATLAVTTSDFVRTAEALGLPRLRIMVSYIFRNAMLRF